MPRTNIPSGKMSVDRGYEAAGFACPSCGSSKDQAVLWMARDRKAFTLRCMSCEYIWSEPDED